MVHHPAEAHVRDGVEAQKGGQIDQKKSESQQRMPAPALTLSPQHDKKPRQHQPRQIFDQGPGIHLPFRIDQQTIHGQKNPGKVNRHDVARPVEPEECPSPRDILRLLMTDYQIEASHPNEREAEHQRDDQERRTGLEIAPLDATTLPPRIEENNHRKRGHGDFTKHGNEKEPERHPIVPLRVARFVIDPKTNCQQEERQGKRVLQLGNPGHRFHLRGMNGEDETSQPSQAQMKFAKDMPDQQRIDQMENDVGKMVSKSIVAPEMPLHPADGLLDGVVINPTPRLEPEFPQSNPIVHQGVCGDVPAIIPYPIAVEDGPVDPQGHPGDEQYPGQPEAPSGNQSAGTHQQPRRDLGEVRLTFLRA